MELEILNELKFVDTEFITSELYALISTQLDKPAIKRSFMNNIANFFNSKHEQLFDIAPYTNIYYNQSDVDKFFKSIQLTEEQVIAILEKVWFWKENYRPKCAKEPYVEVLMCAIRYFLKDNDMKNAELVTIYLCFSGKFYASLYSSYWKYPVNKQVMDYVINGMLTNKFDLKQAGTLFNAIKKLATTWLTTYKDKLKGSNTDDQIGKHIQQLRDREKSFLGNIYTEYRKAIDNKAYLNYETDNLDADSFRLTDNDAALASRLTESAMTIMTTQSVNVDYCNIIADQRVKAYQIKDILEKIILGNKENLPQVRRVINIMICDYFAGNKGASVNSDKFIQYAISAKPNTKNPLIIEMKSTVIGWLEQDAVYRSRSRTPATANSYYSRVLFYFALIIIKANEK